MMNKTYVVVSSSTMALIAKNLEITASSVVETNTGKDYIPMIGNSLGIPVNKRALAKEVLTSTFGHHMVNGMKVMKALMNVLPTQSLMDKMETVDQINVATVIGFLKGVGVNPELLAKDDVTTCFDENIEEIAGDDEQETKPAIEDEVIYHYRYENSKYAKERGFRALTLVQQIDTDGNHYIGVSLCSDKDNFSRKKGVEIAKSEMMKTSHRYIVSKYNFDSEDIVRGVENIPTRVKNILQKLH